MGNSGPPLGIRGNGDWGLGEITITNYQLPITNYQLPIKKLLLYRRD
ncbi:hypothetical protein FDUTEX481_05382 [Tolypothrix sp. PCC 7601]|nr:hypothetical protein FDUTEX481_05382 [Tolypothrix sp. PCC 7601]